jgi:hypothetical protein
MIRRASISVKWWFSVNAEKPVSCEIPALEGGSGLIVSLSEGCGNLLIYSFFLFE